MTIGSVAAMSSPQPAAIPRSIQVDFLIISSWPS
jgi:hypothetical protein